jgi:hypothetical protein
MKVFSSNPLVKDTVETMFRTARERFNIEDDGKVFENTFVVCYIDSVESDKAFMVDCIGVANVVNKTLDSVYSAKAVDEMIYQPGKRVVTFGELKGDTRHFFWVLFKIEKFRIDVEKKQVIFDTKQLLVNVMKVFTENKLVDRNDEEIGKDLLFIYKESMNRLVGSGTAKRVKKDVKP